MNEQTPQTPDQRSRLRDPLARGAFAAGAPAGSAAGSDKRKRAESAAPAGIRSRPAATASPAAERSGRLTRIEAKALNLAARLIEYLGSDFETDIAGDPAALSLKVSARNLMRMFLEREDRRRRRRPGDRDA
jgi:hypothetical protein